MSGREVTSGVSPGLIVGSILFNTLIIDFGTKSKRGLITFSVCTKLEGGVDIEDKDWDIPEEEIGYLEEGSNRTGVEVNSPK